MREFNVWYEVLTSIPTTKNKRACLLSGIFAVFKTNNLIVVFMSTSLSKSGIKTLRLKTNNPENKKCWLLNVARWVALGRADNLIALLLNIVLEQ